MTVEVNLFLHRSDPQSHSLDGILHRSYRRYPNGQIDLPPELPLELPSESPECCDPPDQTLVPCPLLQKPAESRLAPSRLTFHSLRSSVAVTLKTAPPKTVRDQHNLGWDLEVRKVLYQARTCSRTLALRRILRTVSVG
jgi:hypothetical protein